MILCGKNQQPRLKIKLFWQKTLRNGAVRFGAMELQYTVTTDAGFITRLLRYFREQRFRNFHSSAPARTFVGSRGAKLTVVGSTTKRATVHVVQIHRLDVGPVETVDVVRQSILINASAGPTQRNNSGCNRCASNSVPSTTRGPGRLK